MAKRARDIVFASGSEAIQRENPARLRKPLKPELQTLRFYDGELHGLNTFRSTARMASAAELVMPPV